MEEDKKAANDDDDNEESKDSKGKASKKEPTAEEKKEKYRKHLKLMTVSIYKLRKSVEPMVLETLNEKLDLLYASAETEAVKLQLVGFERI